MRNYRSRFLLPNGKWAYLQVDTLADAAREHTRRLRGAWQPPAYFFHYREGGHVAALRCHQTNSHFGKIDLSRFFENVTRHRITRCLKRLGYSFREADDFAVASTVLVSRDPRRFALPYGFIQSPLLASIALDQSELGKCLCRINSINCMLSVYVDDIIVSSKIEKDVAIAVEQILAAAHISKFPINKNKSHGPSETLRAFNIDVDARTFAISGERYQRMCREILMQRNGQASNGIFSYVRSVNENQAKEMLNDFPECFP